MKKTNERITILFFALLMLIIASMVVITDINHRKIDNLRTELQTTISDNLTRIGSLDRIITEQQVTIDLLENTITEQDKRIELNNLRLNSQSSFHTNLLIEELVNKYLEEMEN